MLHVFSFEDRHFSILLKVLADAAKGKEETDFNELVVISALLTKLIQEGTKQRSVIEWKRYPEEKPKEQMVLVCHNGAISTIFGNGLTSFINGDERFYWADIPMFEGARNEQGNSD